VRVSRGLLGASGGIVFFSSPVSRVWCSVLSLGHHRTGANATFFKVERCVTTPAPPRVDIPNDPSCVLKEPRPSRSGRCQLGQRRTFHQGRRSKRKEGLGGDMQRWARCTCQWRCRGEGERNEPRTTKKVGHESTPTPSKFSDADVDGAAEPCRTSSISDRRRAAVKGTRTRDRDAGCAMKKRSEALQRRCQWTPRSTSWARYGTHCPKS
jgi:hypothetical protein